MLKALLAPHGLQAQSVQPNTWAIVPLANENKSDAQAGQPRKP